MNVRIIILLSFLLTTCYSGDRCSQYSHGFPPPWDSQYFIAIKDTIKTPSGINVDTSGLDIDLSKIDKAFDTVETCLSNLFGKDLNLPQSIRQSSYCYGHGSLPICRECFYIKVSPNYTRSCYGNYDLLNIPAPNDGCTSKGQTVTIDCPCRFRTGIENDVIIVVPPDLYMLPDSLVRIVTGCFSPWNDELSVCATPIEGN